MASLRSYASFLTPYLWLSPDALYERQRALVRLGMLPNDMGKGRYAGIQATPETVAALLMSVLITDNLSEVDERVRDLATAPIYTWRKRKYCVLTKATTFGNALIVLLSRRDLSGFVTGISVSRPERQGSIYWDIPGKKRQDGLSTFGHRYQLPWEFSLSVEAKLAGKAIKAISQTLMAEGTSE